MTGPWHWRRLHCERCGHHYGAHTANHSPVPTRGYEGCKHCFCQSYVGYGPASLRRATRDQ